MPNPYFSFKQFTVFHDKCAMKVGTDGVLLGAWADIENAKTILDVGTGSGLMALMVAQRNPNASICAIDIDSNAVEQAKENVRNSVFSSRITVFQRSLQDFTAVYTDTFDAIICNPPFFENSLKSPDTQRTIARHDYSLPLDELLFSSKKLLSEEGRIALIVPCDKLSKIEAICETLSLFITRKTDVKPLPNNEPKRILLEISKVKKDFLEDEIVIETSRHCYSEEYVRLTKEFYLKM